MLSVSLEQGTPIHLATLGSGQEVRLPTELALKIMDYLRPVDLYHASLVSRSWRVICKDEKLWQRMKQIVRKITTCIPPLSLKKLGGIEGFLKLPNYVKPSPYYEGQSGHAFLVNIDVLGVPREPFMPTDHPIEKQIGNDSIMLYVKKTIENQENVTLAILCLEESGLYNLMPNAHVNYVFWPSTPISSFRITDEKEDFPGTLNHILSTANKEIDQTDIRNLFELELKLEIFRKDMYIPIPRSFMYFVAKLFA